MRIEEMIAETAEGKLRLTRAVLRKDVLQAPGLMSKEEESESEFPRSFRSMLTMFEEVALTLSLRLG